MPSTPAPIELSDTARGSAPSGPGDDELPSLPSLALAGFECSLSTTTLEGLETQARTIEPGWVAEQFAQLAATEEVALLATCCRRELVVLARTEEELDRWHAALPGPLGAWRRRGGRDIVHHLYRVAGGGESVVVGEKEVRSQVRRAAGTTLSRHRRRILRDLFEDAATAAEEAAPNVPASRSIAAAAATRVLELCAHPFPRVVIVGAGGVGRQLAELLAPSARLTIVYRQRAPDEAFLRSTGARAVRLDRLVAEVRLSDAVVTAAKSGDRCLGPNELPRGRPLIVVDLGVPRNVDPAVRDLPLVRLVDLAQLGSRERRATEPGTLDRLAESADRFADRLERLALEAWISNLRRRAEEVRVDELEVARTYLGVLTADQSYAVERLTRRLVDRLFLAPTTRLRALPAGEDGDRLRRFALDLLRPGPHGP